MRAVFAFLGILLFSCAGLAQIPATSLYFDHDGVNTASYKLSIDTAPAVAVTATVVTAPVPPKLGTYSIPLPALTAGTHTITVAACSSTNVCATSLPFSPGVPLSPANLRLTVTITIGQ
jgi:uncharacterized membrane protein YvlD (DUF360 family)